MTVALSMDLPPGFRVDVQTTNNRGFTPEEIAERCVNKLVSVSDNAHPAIKEQAHTYKLQMQMVIARYMREAILSDRVTVYNVLANAGHPDLAELIRSL